MLNQSAFSLLNMSFQERLKLALSESDLNQGEVARRAGISAGALTMWKNGTIMNPEARHIASIARVLGIQSDWLIDGKGPMRSGQPHTDADIQAQAQLQAPPGFTALLIPDELAPLVQSWLALYVNRTIPNGLLESVTAMADSLNPAITPQGAAKATPARIAAANKALEEHRAEAIAAGTAGQVKPGVFKAKR